MDNHSFNEIFNFYLSKFENTAVSETKTFNAMPYNQLVLAFRSMLDRKILRSYCENRLKQMRDRIKAIALAKDVVIPAASIIETLSGTGSKHTVSVKDFPFPYSHEAPFPLLKTGLSAEVDKSFDTVFSEASAFLS